MLRLLYKPTSIVTPHQIIVTIRYDTKGKTTPINQYKTYTNKIAITAHLTAVPPATKQRLNRPPNTNTRQRKRNSNIVLPLTATPAQTVRIYSELKAKSKSRCHPFCLFQNPLLDSHPSYCRATPRECLCSVKVFGVINQLVMKFLGGLFFILYLCETSLRIASFDRHTTW